MSEAVVYLNVGGVYFMTRRSTLAGGASSFFTGMVRAQPSETEFFVDRDPTHFRHVLNWLRGVCYLPEDEPTLHELAWEADFFCLQDMRDAIQRRESVSVLRTLDAICGELRQR